MLSTLISLLSPCALLYLVYLQANLTRLIRNVETEVLELRKKSSQLVSPPPAFTYRPLLGKKRKAVHVDIEYVRVTAMRLGLGVVYKAIWDFLKDDNSEAEITIYSTTNPRVQSLNFQLRDMECHVIEQPVFFSPEGKVSNTNTDALMVEGLIIDSPPQHFSTVVIISGDHKFAECARLLALRGQRSEFIGFESNTAQEIKSLAKSHDLVGYQSLESIPGAITEMQRGEQKSAS
jgi:hypothetical protein